MQFHNILHQWDMSLGKNDINDILEPREKLFTLIEINPNAKTSPPAKRNNLEGSLFIWLFM